MVHDFVNEREEILPVMLAPASAGKPASSCSRWRMHLVYLRNLMSILHVVNKKSYFRLSNQFNYLFCVRYCWIRWGSKSFPHIGKWLETP